MCRWWCWRRDPSRAPTSCPARSWTRARSNELFPDWKELGAPLTTPVTDDIFLFTSEKGASRTPNFLLPKCFHNDGCYILSLANFTRWLAQQAEGLGVEIFPGFAAAEVLYNENGSVKGVATGNMGIGKDGEPTDSFQLGMELHAKYTIFAEGSRGHLGKQLIARFKLDEGRDPQTYSIGIKELWEIDPSRHKPGLVLHSAGWPLDDDTYGGSFMYHMEDNQVACGYVVGLDYKNPWLSPFEEFQRWKTHPNIRWYFEGAAGGQAGQLRRSGPHGGRPVVAAQDGVPGRRAGGLRSGLPERGAHQGQPRRHQDRHARRRRGLRSHPGGPAARRTRGVSGGLRKVVAARRAEPVAQLQVLVQEGTLRRHA